MKQRQEVKVAGPPALEALRILQGIPGVTVIAEPDQADHGVDAVLEFAGSRARVAVQVKTRANAAAAWHIIHQREAHPGNPVLLVAGETTAEARTILAEHGIGVVDGLGNAHVELPGLLVHLEGRRPPRQARPARLTGKAGVVAQALLLHRERSWQVHYLAQEAGVSLGLTHRVLTRLGAEGVVAMEGTGPRRVRRVTQPAALLDLWAEENTERPTRTLAYLLAQSPRRLITTVGRNLDQSGHDYAITGAAAASLVAPFATAVPVAEVWMPAALAPEQLCELAGADPVSEGPNVIFLQAKDDTPLAFRERADEVWVANRFRLYADLRRDPRRGREQAEHLRQELIGF
jgi:hypothetical protein